MGLFDSVKEAFESDPQKLADWTKQVADLQAKLASAHGNEAAEIQKEIDAKSKQITDMKAKLGITDSPAPEAAAAAVATEQAQQSQDAAVAQAAYDATIAAQEAAAKTAAEAEAKAAAAAAAAAASAPVVAAQASVPEYRTYEVKPGDTLSKIGREFGVSYTSIAELNGIENPDLIYPGQVFNIPN